MTFFRIPVNMKKYNQSLFAVRNQSVVTDGAQILINEEQV
jgi:hypothetical protein